MIQNWKCCGILMFYSAMHELTLVYLSNFFSYHSPPHSVSATPASFLFLIAKHVPISGLLNILFLMSRMFFPQISAKLAPSLYFNFAQRVFSATLSKIVLPLPLHNLPHPTSPCTVLFPSVALITNCHHIIH